jgi:hypothetical protein
MLISKEFLTSEYSPLELAYKPYVEGFYNLKIAISLWNPEYSDLSLKDSAFHVGAGVALLIPVINMIVFTILLIHYTESIFAFREAQTTLIAKNKSSKEEKIEELSAMLELSSQEHDLLFPTIQVKVVNDPFELLLSLDGNITILNDKGERFNFKKIANDFLLSNGKNKTAISNQLNKFKNYAGFVNKLSEGEKKENEDPLFNADLLFYVNSLGPMIVSAQSSLRLEIDLAS